ncbi:MAG: hypothetical protein K0Q55_2422, partial [Verrucomicrobia bacterium]|nr:hypothetical protein [Verrucomicrobiota bacterium]
LIAFAAHIDLQGLQTTAPQFQAMPLQYVAKGMDHVMILTKIRHRGQPLRRTPGKVIFPISLGIHVGKRA